jgi:hypothetical protein
LFASAWETNQPVQFISYVYNQRGKLTEKASVTINISQATSNLNFSKYGGDFRHISAFKIVATRGSAGVYNHYYHSTTYGYEIAIDNLKLAWNGPIPHGARSGHHAHLPHTAVRAHGVAHPGGGDGHGPPASSHITGHHTQPYHSVLATLASIYEHSGSLTEQFHLPRIEHGLGS